MQAFVAAVRFLTRIRLPRGMTAEDVDFAAAKIFFPAVGLVIGAILASVYWLMAAAGMWIAAVCVLVAWVWVTGALHLDGLGDVADGLGAAHGKPERFFEVLKDPHVGSFAVVAIALQLAAKLVFVAHLPAMAVSLWALLLIPAWARWGVLVWSGTLPPLQPGLGQAVAAQASWLPAIAWALGLGLASAVLAPPLLVSVAIVVAIAGYWRWRLGGITGDCLGASVEVTEALALLAVVLLSV